MKSFIPLFSFVVTIGYTSAAAVGKLPPDFDTCARNNPQFEACSIKAIEKAVVSLSKGYQPLGIQGLDPLMISAISIEQGDSPVSINLKFRDLKITGIKTVKVHAFKSNFKNLTLTGAVTIPRVFLDGFYNISGKVLILPITGDGKSRLTLDGIAANVIIVGKHFKKDGKTYMKVNRFDFDFTLKKLSLNFDNLFNGDKLLGDNMNKFVNENSQDILKEVLPAVRQAFGLAFADISNRIFNKVPFEEIFPLK